MKIILGSTSQQKIKIIKQVVPVAEIISVEVESGITDQPLDEETTIQGSINRAKNAVIVHRDDFDLSVGLEGGLSYIQGLYHLVCAVSVVDKNGRVYVGISKKLPLPKKVSLHVEQGKQFGEVIREYEKSLQNRNVPKLLETIEELISREKSFTEAAEIAFLQCELAEERY